jgi:uncharacterized membrane protein (UPF0127 family)
MSFEPLPRLPRTVLPDGRVLITASTPHARLVGLSRTESLPDDRALLLLRCRSVHTVAMAFALDLIWLDADGRPVRLDCEVAPWRIRSCRPARAVVEAAAGAGAGWALALHHEAGVSRSSGCPDRGVGSEECRVRRSPSSDGGCPS